VEQEKINLNPQYGFLNNRDFLRIKENMGGKFDSEDLANIDKLLKADKDIIIGEFHNFFSSYKSNYLKELEQEIARGFSDEETKEIFQIFHTFLKKYNENICWNIESFVEQYKGD